MNNKKNNDKDISNYYGIECINILAKPKKKFVIEGKNNKTSNNDSKNQSIKSAPKKEPKMK
ncbi:hypothetical protein [Cetobacterium ceti]